MKIILIIATLLFTVLQSSTRLNAQTNTTKQAILALAQRSDISAIGRIVDVSAYRNREGGRIFSNVNIEVNNYLKGNGSNQLIIQMRGGTLGGKRMFVPQEANFVPGDVVLVFLKRLKGSEKFRVTLGQNGKYRLQNSETGSMFINDLSREPLEISMLNGETIPVSLVKKWIEDSDGGETP